MKIKDGYILREVAGSHVVVPVRDADLNGMITLNDTGALLWERLQRGCSETELLQALCSEFEVDEVAAKADIGRFLDRLTEAGLLDG